jgi:FtsZ-binding cell division protein ZapB
MSALDTAKEIGRMAATATLSKDVIDLFEKKVALLTEQVAALETENSDLKQKVGNLQQELSRLQPQSDRLEEGAEKVLRFLFDRDDDNGLIAVEAIARDLAMIRGVTQYHCDTLYEREMVGMGMLGTYHIDPPGRAYVVKYLLTE